MNELDHVTIAHNSERISKLEVRVEKVVQRQYDTERLLAVSNEQQSNMLIQLKRIDGHISRMVWLVLTGVITGMGGIGMLLINNGLMNQLAP